ncbi:Uncharacterised protein [Mycobacterium tuberculosis]|uniref:Uncharacterized protein n=2 Tax=Mycobacterium tuberculosis TaxID=1773 RepID=A0A0U0RRF0_MYCTX|nr:Uncharacterised protein [Mycobacterium tuberculosis]CFE46672.1 Uncharacterised protein [Mycobacterium tuberculosis]COW00954.1 Uncharacterised protein [Mycobacterium tuberculosis]COW19300.1 Uncharacterised protein [Mycobacterium tuberculosis]COW24639.1 Uncharacterised protein [Mycobacterium tuberculosis]
MAIGRSHIAAIDSNAAAIRSATLGCVLHAGRSARFQMARFSVRCSSSRTDATVMPSTGPISVAIGTSDKNGRRPGAHGSRMKFSVNAST